LCLLLAVTAFAAGMVNALAGGGTLLLLPALMLAGLPVVVANATATVALVPGYLMAAWGGRAALRAGRLDGGAVAAEAPPGASAATAVLVTMVAAAAGAWLLSQSSDALFSRIVPWLVLLATLLFAVGAPHAARGRRYLLLPGLALACLYGGYFNGALGVVLLAVLSLSGMPDLHGANAWKNLLSALVSMTAALVLGLAGLLAWPQLLVAAAAAGAGGLAGAALAGRLSAQRLRGVVVAIGLGAAAWLFLR